MLNYRVSTSGSVDVPHDISDCTLRLHCLCVWLLHDAKVRGEGIPASWSSQVVQLIARGAMSCGGLDLHRVAVAEAEELLPGVEAMVLQGLLKGMSTCDIAQRFRWLRCS